MKKNLARLGTLALCVSASIYTVVACSDPDTEVKPSGNDSGVDASSQVDANVAIDAGTDAAPAPVPVTITFKAKVGTEDFHCGTNYAGQGSTNETVTPTDLRFYVQDVKLVDAEGNLAPVTLDERARWQTHDVALLDFEDGTGSCLNGTAELNDKIIGKVAPGTYTGIVFTNGVPESINHGDPATAPDPLTAGGMSWGWLLGYRFIKAEMKSIDAGMGIGLFHLGSLGCVNVTDGGAQEPNQAPVGPCSIPNRNVVRLTPFSAASNVIVLDAKTIFAQSDLSMMNMCHGSGAACTPMAASVGVDADGGAALTTHPAFRVE